MVLGYFGSTPVEPDPEVVKIASEQLNLPVTKEAPVDIAERDPKKGLEHWKKVCEEEGIPTTEENVFIATACQTKGIAFLKGKTKATVRKITEVPEISTAGKKATQTKVYRVNLNHKQYDVQVDSFDEE
jgi:pyruvate carboxylase subunit B